MTRAKRNHAERDRHAVNKHARHRHLTTTVLRALGADVLTPAEVCERLPELPSKDVRRALLALHADGVLTRVVDATAVLYALSVEEAHRS